MQRKWRRFSVIFCLFWAFLSFKPKPVTQVFIRNIQVKIWKSFYAFIFVWVCIYFSVYKYLSCVPAIGCIKNQPAFYGKYRLIKITWKFSRTRMRHIEINLLKSTLMQIWNLKISHSLSHEFLSYSLVKFVYFVKSRLIFNIFYCFCMFVNKHFVNFTGI